MSSRVKQLAAAACGLLLAGALRAETVPQFTGNNSYVDVGTPDALQIPSSAPFTIEGWMVFDALSTRDMLYCKNNGRSGPPYTYMFGFADHKLSAYNSAWRGNFAVAREIGRWYHVAFSFDGSTLSFYLDGALLGSIAFSFNNNAAHTVKLGGYDASSDTKGRKSDVRVWDHARTQAQIQAAMRERLTGEEDGLLACWPLADGAGAAVADRSPNGCDGALVNASWAADDTLTLLDFILANPVTGSGRFTNTNRLGVVRMPSVDGYADCQITQGGAPPSAGAWLSTDAPPATVVLDVPGSADAEVTVTAWLTNTSAAVALQRIDRKVAFTAVAPVPLIAATAARQLLPGCGALFYPEDLDGGSGGGEVFSSAIPVHRLQLQWVGGPAADASPDEPWVTLHKLGDYELELVVCNAAGNVATSSVCAATVEPWSGEPFIWTGAVGAEWSERLNWNHAVVPPAGAAVFLDGGAAVTLADSTAALGSLVISNATLTFVNWETVLAAADVHAGPGAAITHAGPVKDGMMSNRVHIVCSNFTLAAGATIAVDDKGYAGTRNGTAGFYGNGPGRPTRERGAASHGGMGGGSGSGPAYGDPAQPLHPGSGGDGQYGATGGHGGGSVRIAAAGRAVVNGSILASSSNVGGNSGGGAGGSIYLTAATVVATGGVLRANGASTTQMGGGGGGRIAVAVSDPAAQAALPRVVLGLSARRGDRTTINGEHGTVWLSDRSLMPAVMNRCNGIFLGIGGGAWHVPELAMTDSWVVADVDLDLTVDGDMRLTNAILDTARLAVAAGGSLSLGGASSLYVRSGPTNGVAPWGSRVTVGGALSLGAGSTIYPASCPTNGGSVCFTVGDLSLASGAAINADGLGFAGAPVTGYGPGGGTGSYGGGGYGGGGGRPPYGGRTYGSAPAPSDPGSGGAGRNGKSGTGGGGLIRLHVAGTATIDGTLTANGLSAGADRGCGSGGGIFLDADTLATAFGAICADGGDNSSSYGAGGGGRIALRYRIDNFDGTLTARGGTGAYPGGEGSIVRELDASYVSLILAGYPVRHGTCQPYDYGLNGVIAGSVVTNTVNSPADEAGGEHFVCLGWSATNAIGQAFSGGGTQAVATVGHDTWLTWHWTNRYHLAITTAAGGGLAADPSGWHTNGLSASVTAVAAPGYRFLQWAGPGLPHENFLDNPLTLVMDRTRAVEAVFAAVEAPATRVSAQSGAWLDAATWTPPGIPGEGDTIHIAGHTVTLDDPSRAAALTLSDGGRLDLGERTWLHVAGDTTVTGATARLNLNQGNLVGGGRLDLLDGAQMHVHSGPCEFPAGYDHTHPPATAYGSLVQLAGDLLIASNSVVFSQSHSATNGGTALFRVRKLIVAAGGRFDADHLGYPGGPNSYELGGYGPGAGLVDRGSGSYGGQGSNGGGPTYGSSVAPVQAGSSGGGAYGQTGGAGGGAIRVQAARWVTLDGVLTASGKAGHHDSGAGAGGSIFLDCAGLRGAGTMRARGGDNTTFFGAGGGGRIAVWTTGIAFDTNRVDAVSVAGGTSTTAVAEAGTVYWLIRPAAGTVLLLR